MAENRLRICNGRVLDGSGAPPYPADITVMGDRITAITPVDSPDVRPGIAEAGETIFDAAGSVVCPGFIDTHSHSDLTLFDEPGAWNKLGQGVTTEIAGMCGLSLAPTPSGKAAQVADSMPFLSPGTRVLLDRFADFDRLLIGYAQLPPGTNLATYLGHGTLRAAVMGSDPGLPRPGQLNEMRARLAEAMQAGAMGISFGLIYPPGVFSQIDELAALAEVAAHFGGSVSVHLRSEGNHLEESVEEMLEVARRSGAPVLFSHHKAAGQRNWGKVRRTLKRLEQAGQEGLRVMLDAYPYTASATSLKTLIPARFHECGGQGLLDLLASPAGRAAIRGEMIELSGTGETQFEYAGFANTMVIDSPNRPETRGKTLAQLAQERGEDPFTTLFDLLQADQLASMAAYFIMDSEDVDLLMQHPQVMVGTDGATIAPGTNEAPRAVGAFPRILGRYVRERGLLSLPEAVRKMTSLPAQALQLKDRGLVKAGYFADLVLFEPATIMDQADFVHFDRPNLGIRAVFVNGILAASVGKVTGERAGHVIRRTV